MHTETPSTVVETILGPLMLRRTGSGRPALLWHSLFVDSGTFAPVLEGLRRQRELFLVDGPGHGGSPGPYRLYSLADCATAAIQVLDALGITERVDWVGNAWGGHVGLIFASRFPDRCRSLVTIGTPAYPLTTAERRKSAALVYLYRLLGPAPFARLIADALVGKGTAGTAPSAVGLVRAAFSGGDRRGKYWAMQSVMLHRPDLRPVLPQLKVPVLMLIGRDDPMNDPREAEQAARSIPGGRFGFVRGAGHVAPLLLAPADVTWHVLAFWDRDAERQAAA